MDRLKLDDWCEKIILGLVLAILGFSALATGCVRPQDFVVIQWLIVLVLAFWLCRFYLNPKHRLLWSPLCWAALAFMIYAVIRYLTADVEYLARQELIKVLLYGLLLFAIITNLHRLEATQIVTIFVLCLGAIISLYAVYQFLTGSDRVWHFVRAENYQRRGSGTFLSPNSAAAYFAMLLPLGLTHTLTGRLSHLQKVFIGYASLVIFGGIVATVSRGGWLATVTMMLVYFGLLLRQRNFRLQGFLMAVVLIAVAAGSLGLAKLSEDRRKSLGAPIVDEFRFRLWEPAWKMWKDHPWTGVGPDHFDTRFRQYRPPLADLQSRPGRVHNDYLNTLVDWGLIGSLLVASVWAIFYWEVFRSWKFVQRQPSDLAAKRSNKSAFVLGGSLGLLAILVHSFVDFNFYIPANAILAVVLLGLVAGHFRFATERYWFTVRWPLKIVVTLALLSALCYLIPQSSKHSKECHWIAKAEENLNDVTNRVTALKQAFHAEPKNFETAYDIGETLRLLAWEGREGFKATTEEAMQWFRKAIDLNAYDPFSQMRLGMCLDWLERHAEAEPHFQKALELDPNGYYVIAHVGWHYFQTGDFVTAKRWFDRSIGLSWNNNPISHAYLEIIRQKMTEAPKS